MEPDTLSLEPDEGEQVQLMVLYDDNTQEPVSDVEWASSDEQVATVNEDGFVEAHSPGHATISADNTSMDIVVNEPVEVEQPEVSDEEDSEDPPDNEETLED